MIVRFSPSRITLGLMMMCVAHTSVVHSSAAQTSIPQTRDTTSPAPARSIARTAAGRPLACSIPTSERPQEAGCYLTVEVPLGILPARELYWHIYTYPTRAAADDARGPRGTVVEVFGKYWLYTIADERWTPAAGERVTVIGPLQVETGKPYTARYMEAVFPPGFNPGGPGHRHPGPEAWYLVSGGQCLETPNGLVIANAGGSAMVPEGWPMTISAMGPETRRSLVLILHKSDLPFSMDVDDAQAPGAPHVHWRPRGLCPK